MRSLLALIGIYLVFLPCVTAQTNEGGPPPMQRSMLEPRGFLYGVGGISNQEVYQGFGQRNVLIPMIGYRGDRLTVFGPFISYDLLQEDGWRVSARLSPRFAGFSEEDSEVFTGMARRHNSIDVGMGVQRDWGRWRFDTSFLHDALGASDGFEFRNRISYVHVTNGFFIEPQLGIDYADSRLTNYYYGVRNDEATLLRPEFTANSVINYSFGIAVMTPRYLGGMTRLSVEHRWFGSSIDDSPLTDRNTGVQVFLSFSRFIR